MISIKKKPLLLTDGKIQLCKCGCNKEIPFRKWQLRNGIPDYLIMHSPSQKETREKNGIYLKKHLETAKGINHPNFGRHWTEEQNKKRIRAGENSCHYGVPRSEEVRKKISISHIGLKDSNETREKKRLARIGELNPQYGKPCPEHTKQRLSEANTGENNGFWNNGSSFYTYCPKFNNNLKERIRREHNRKCAACGKSESKNILSTGKQIRLAIHHIDRDKKQGCEGKQWKLIPLCVSCHSKAHTQDFNIGIK